jgi:hypothetical protein
VPTATDHTLVLPAVAVDDVIDELDAADLGHPAGDVDAVALGAGRSRAGAGPFWVMPWTPWALLLMTTFSPKRPRIVELDAVARVLMDDVAVNQQVPDLDDPLIEE